MLKFKTLAVIAVIGVMTACMKNESPQPCTPKTVESEMAAMNKFATDSSITVTNDASGLLYQIIEPGTGFTPGPQSTVKVNYHGRLLNGVEFDRNYTGNFSFKLNEVIVAWQIALQKIKPGGKMKIITPSALAYSCNPYVPPALNNQPLYFYIELLHAQ